MAAEGGKSYCGGGVEEAASARVVAGTTSGPGDYDSHRRQHSAAAAAAELQYQYQLSRTPEELAPPPGAGGSRYRLQPRLAASPQVQQHYLHPAELASIQHTQAQAQLPQASAAAQQQQGNSFNTHEVDFVSHSLLSTSPAGYFNFAPSTCLATSPHSLAALGGGVGGSGRRSAAAAATVASPSAGLRSTPTGNRSLLLRSESIPEGESLDMGNEPSRAARGADQARAPPGGASNLTVLMEKQERRERDLRRQGSGGASAVDESSASSTQKLSSDNAATAAANAAAEALAAMALEGPSGAGAGAALPAEDPQHRDGAACRSPHRISQPQDYRPSPGPGRAPPLQRGRHTYSPGAGIGPGSGSWAPASLPNHHPSDILPSAAAAAAAAVPPHHLHHQQQYLIPPPQPVLLPPHPAAMAGFAACSAGRSAPSELLVSGTAPRTMASSLPIQHLHQHQHQQCRRISAPLLLPGTSGYSNGVSRGSVTAAAAARSHAVVGDHCKFVRRCVSNRELGDIAPSTTALSTSPYAAMLYRKEALEAASQQRLMESRLASLKNLAANTPPRSMTPLEESSSQSSESARQQGQSRPQQLRPQHQAASGEGRQKQRCMNNEARKNRRAQHNQAVIDDLCEIVADLFIAEKKLLHLTGPFEEGESAGGGGGGTGPLEAGDADQPAAGEIGGVDDRRRAAVLDTVRQFVSELPPRYALGVETPSAVLVHMRLMAAARSDDMRAAVHIANIDGGNVRGGSGRGTGTSNDRRGEGRSSVMRLVTISCADCDGLLEFITKLLGTGGARVLDADVMLTTDSIVLDRFVVEMKGRLRLDKLQQYIENYLKESRENREENVPTPPSPLEEQPETVARPPSTLSRFGSSESAGARPVGSYGPLYFNAPKGGGMASAQDRLEEEMQTAVPLSRVLESAAPGRVRSHGAAGAFHRQLSAPMPETTSASIAVGDMLAGGVDAQEGQASEGTPSPTGQSSGESGGEASRPVPSPPSSVDERSQSRAAGGGLAHRRRPLVNRAAVNFGSDDGGSSFGGHGGSENDAASDAVPPAVEGAVPEEVAASGLAIALEQNGPVLPLIPFDELMLIETLGSGRVSTIYRAAWQPLNVDSPAAMVALKVATVDPASGGMEHVEELRREADIATMLEHNNICSLVGVASDPECFCLAYEFCEGGSLLSLLSNSSRCYEYLPIALDIANGMAYLHSRNVIHRDLKPSNILLTRDNRAKIADFGMSVTNFGQELTAETGTYRWMAPEVIRHENYGTNADVYSFGVVLWQLITREVPFATLSPIQTAYAVAEGCRPEIPASTPEPLQRIIRACWDEDSHKRPSFTYIAMALADYAKMAFNPANVGAQTVQIANEMLANVQGNSTVNVDFTTPVTTDRRQRQVSMPNMKGRTASFPRGTFFPHHQGPGSFTGSDIGLQI